MYFWWKRKILKNNNQNYTFIERRQENRRLARRVWKIGQSDQFLDLESYFSDLKQNCLICFECKKIYGKTWGWVSTYNNI